MNDNELAGPDTAFALTRRRFAVAGSALALAACGGGGGDPPAAAPGPAPAPPPAPVPSPAPTPSPTPPPTQRLELLAGATGAAGMAEGRGHEARLDEPFQLATRADGAVFLAARSTRFGRVSSDGDLRFLADLVDLGITGLAVDSHGVLHVTGGGTGQVLKLVEDGTPHFVALAGRAAMFPGGGFQDGIGLSALLRFPRAPVFDPADQLYFIDAENRAIRRVTPAGEVTTVAGQPAHTTLRDGQGADAGFAQPTGMVRLPDGALLVLDGTRWRRVTPDGAVATYAATNLPPLAPGSLVLADAEHVYAALGHAIVRVGLDGSVASLAGDPASAGHVDGDAAGARFNQPADLALQGGMLVVADRGNHALRRVDLATGQVQTWVGAAPQAARVDGTGAAARFVLGEIWEGPLPMARDAAGNVYVLDRAAKTVRKATPAGVVTTMVPDFPSEGGLAVDAAGQLYGVRDRAVWRVSPAGAQTVFAGRPGVAGFADGPADRAEFSRPRGLAFDPAGNLFVGDAPEVQGTGSFTNTVRLRWGNTIRKVSPAGVVSTFAGVPGREIPTTVLGDQRPLLSGVVVGDPVEDFHAPDVLVTDATGNLLVLDNAWRNVRRIAAGGGTPFVLASASDGGSDGVLTTPIAATVTPGGTVYFAQYRFSTRDGSASVTLRRLDAVGSSALVAGREAMNSIGLVLGPLPAGLNVVRALVALDERQLVLASENALVRVVLA